ncbi:cell division protein ZapE [Halomonas cupida]|nr:cell division protein ZapE [Halomonas cupida]
MTNSVDAGLLSPMKAWQSALDGGLIVDDPGQRSAVAELEACHQGLDSDGAARGVYLWGRVGRGKTWLMNLFAASCPVAVRRLHFHHFMRWVHRRQLHWRGHANPLTCLARELATEVAVLCLDELYVEDIADAILLGGLMSRLFDQGVVVVATSNQPPQELYREGYNRERFLPAIDAILANMTVVAVDGDMDHRHHPGETCQRYHVRRAGQPSRLPMLFAKTEAAVQYDLDVDLGARTIHARGVGRHTLWCDYAALCETPLAAVDFIALCDRFQLLLLGNLPSLVGEGQQARIARGTEDASHRVVAGDRELPPLSSKDDGVRRFIALVDECYDRGVPLIIEAEVAMDELYSTGHLAFAFRRTRSRLQEMQLQRFGRLNPAVADLSS